MVYPGFYPEFLKKYKKICEIMKRNVKKRVWWKWAKMKENIDFEGK